MDLNDKEVVQFNNVKKSSKDTFMKMTEFFTTYLNDMFTDLSKIIIKKLDEQQKKINKNQKHLKEISRALAQKSHCSSTSFGDIESQTSIQQKKRKKISSFKQAKDFMSIQKISQILLKMESNVLYLQNSLSLTKLKSTNEIQDPQTEFVESQEYKLQQKTKQTQPTQTTLTSKISKLSTKISKLAKQSSIEQIEKQNSFMLKKCNLPKSKSLLSISSRKYHPVSCPKKYDYGLGSGRNWSQSEIDKQTGKEKQYGSKNEEPSQILFPSKNIQNITCNKMPLINQANHVLNQLLQSCQDEADANVIKFHLKKTYKKVDEMINDKKKQVTSKNVLVDVSDKQNISKTFVVVPEYFSNKSLSRVNLTQCQSQQNTNSAQCSIVGNLSTTQLPHINWIKQNYQSFHTKCLNQNDRSVLNYGQKKDNLTQTQNSQQKRKYFQRTSNDKKISMLKKKLKAQIVKI